MPWWNIINNETSVLVTSLCTFMRIYLAFGFYLYTIILIVMNVSSCMSFLDMIFLCLFDTVAAEYSVIGL